MGGKNISILANLLIPSETARGRSPIKDLQPRTPKQPEEEMIERKRGRSLTKKDCITNTEVRNNRDVKVVKEKSEEDNAADDNRGRSRLGDIYVDEVEIKHIKAKPTNCRDMSVDSKKTTNHDGAKLESSESEELSESERGRGRSRTRKDYRARKESVSPGHKVPTKRTQSMPPKSTKIVSFENQRISPPSKTRVHSVPPATNGAPKRRGRPPGSKNRVKSKLPQNSNGDESSVRLPLRDRSQSLTRDGAPAPKRRGRPPGSKNRPKPANNVQSNCTNSTSIVPTTPTVKRRPGRPRKKPLPDDVNTGSITQSITGKRKEREQESVNINNQSHNEIQENPRRGRPLRKKIAVSEDAESSQRLTRSIPVEPKPVYGRGKKYNFQHIIEKNSTVKSKTGNKKRIVDEIMRQNDPKRDIGKHQEIYDSGRGKWVPSRQENFDTPLRVREKYLGQNKSSASRSPSPELAEIESSSGKQRRSRRRWVPKEVNQDEIKRDIPLRSPSLESVEIMPRKRGRERPNVKNQPSRNSNKTSPMLEGNNNTPRKRGPGRPPTKNRIPANIKKRITSLETFDSTQIPAKRPRGRPPLIKENTGRGKTILPQDNTSTDESSSEESTESVEQITSEQEPTFQFNNESENELGSEELDEEFENLNESVRANQKSVKVIPKTIQKGESVELSSLLFPFSLTEPGLIQGLDQGAFRVGFKDSLLVDSQNLTPAANDVDMIIHDLF